MKTGSAYRHFTMLPNANEIGKFLSSMLKENQVLHLHEVGGIIHVSIEAVAELIDDKWTIKLRSQYNTFANSRGLKTHMPAFKPKQGKGFPKLAFAPVDDILLFLRARKSDAAQALVRRIDEAIADQQKAAQAEVHQEELQQRDHALFEQETARKREEDRRKKAEEAILDEERKRKEAEEAAKKAEEEKDAQFEFDQATIEKLQGEKEKLEKEKASWSPRTLKNLGFEGKTTEETAKEALQRAGYVKEFERLASSISDKINVTPRMVFRLFIDAQITTHIYSDEATHDNLKEGSLNMVEHNKAAAERIGRTNRPGSKFTFLGRSEMGQVISVLNRAEGELEQIMAVEEIVPNYPWEEKRSPSGNWEDNRVAKVLNSIETQIQGIGNQIKEYGEFGRCVYGAHNSLLHEHGKLDELTSRKPIRHSVYHMHMHSRTGKTYSYPFDRPNVSIFGHREEDMNKGLAAIRGFRVAFLEEASAGKVRFPSVGFDPKKRSCLDTADPSETKNWERINSLLLKFGIKQRYSGEWALALFGWTRKDKSFEQSGQYEELQGYPSAVAYTSWVSSKFSHAIALGVKPTEHIEGPGALGSDRTPHIQTVAINEFLHKRGRILNEIIALTRDVHGSLVDYTHKLPAEEIFQRIKSHLIHYEDLARIMNTDDQEAPQPAYGHSRETILYTKIEDFKFTKHSDTGGNGVTCIVISVLWDFFFLRKKLNGLNDDALQVWCEAMKNHGNDFDALFSAMSNLGSSESNALTKWEDALKTFASEEYVKQHGVIIPVYNKSIQKPICAGGKQRTGKRHESESLQAYLPVFRKPGIELVLKCCKEKQSGKIKLRTESKLGHPVHDRPGKHRKCGKGKFTNCQEGFMRKGLALIF